MKEYAEYDSRLVVVDSYDVLTDENGIAVESLFRDSLHPNMDGYDLMFEAAFEAGLEISR